MWWWFYTEMTRHDKNDAVGNQTIWMPKANLTIWWKILSIYKIAILFLQNQLCPFSIPGRTTSKHSIFVWFALAIVWQNQSDMMCTTMPCKSELMYIGIFHFNESYMTKVFCRQPIIQIDQMKICSKFWVFWRHLCESFRLVTVFHSSM
jgi:hypothetical protein